MLQRDCHCSGDGASLQTSRGVTIGNAVAPQHAPELIDTLVIAGGEGAETGHFEENYIRWVRETAERSRRVAGICTGAFVLAAAGVLEDKNAVTHWRFCDRLAREYPRVNVTPDRIFLRDGAVYTSAGITAGIDLALALVEEDLGREASLAIARQLVMFLVRPGGQAQYSHMLSRQAATSKPLQELQVYMMENLRENLSVDVLAERIGMSPRHFSRVCLRETKMNPGQFVDRLRVEAAQQLIDSSNMGLNVIADACGFGSADSMRRSFLRILRVSASEYAERFRRANSLVGQSHSYP